MAEVFVNYRRGDGDAVADLIALYLLKRFGAEHVFKASRSIPPGTEYRSALNGAVRECEVLLAVMGPDWPRSERLRDPDDWVRNEILEAFAAGKCVIPVLNGRMTDRLRAADLPPELARLAYLQSRRFDTHTSKADLDQIGQTVIDLVPGLKAADQSAGEPAARGATDNSASDNSGTVVQSGTIGGNVVNVSDTGGPTQVGDGGTQINLLLARLRAFQARRQPVDQQRWLSKRFVRPPGFDDAVNALAAQRTVVLDGPPGAGRTAAAKILLESEQAEGRLHELEPQEPNDETSFHLHPDFIRPYDRVWVDLSSTETSLWNAIQGELPELRTRVLECHARMIIIKPHHEKLRPEFRPYLRRIQGPATLEVFRHLLRTEELLREDDTCNPPRFLESARSMAAVQQYVDDILGARDETGGEGGLEAWIAMADEWATPREKQVRDALNQLTRTPQRALLLSVAMLHGTHADVIDRAATTLLTNLNDETDTALKRRPLDDRLKEIGAQLDAFGYVRFASTRYEFAVRGFFWRHFPELHNATATLVRTALDSEGLSDHQREDLVHGFADQCLEQRYQAFWTELVQYLTEGRRSLARMSAAAAVLEHGLSDEKNGRTFRQQIYRWSKDNDISGSLAQVLVAACEVMAYTHPEEALVRLHHLARRHPRQVGARDALVTLARGHSWLLSLLLFRLTRMSPETAWPTDVGVFLEIADATLFTAKRAASQPLITQDRVAGQLTAGWTLLFVHLGHEEWAPTAHEWLRCAAEDDANRHALLDVLVDGAERRADLLSRLFGLAHRAEFRDAISGLLLKKISAAQGVELT